MAENTSRTLKQFPSLQSYLFAKGVTPSTPKSEVDTLKKEHRKAYQRLYDQERRTKKKRLQQDVSKQQYQRLKKEAKRHKVNSPSAFVLKCALAYLDERYIQHDSELIRQYTIQISRIGNNINQLAHYCHYHKDYANKEVYQQLKQQVDKLENTIEEHLNQSLPIGKELVRLFEQDPQMVIFFENFLTEWRAKNEGE